MPERAAGPICVAPIALSCQLVGCCGWWVTMRLRRGPLVLLSAAMWGPALVP